MIAFEDALAAALEHARPLDAERLPLSAAHGRVLREPLTTPWDLPRFSNSAVDGFGVHLKDLGAAADHQPVILPIAGTLAAGGDVLGRSLVPGTTLKIMTGAAVPDGVDAVVMREQVTESEGQARFTASARVGANIRRRGEELPAGSQLLEAGTLITPPVVGLLATVGVAEVTVTRVPRVHVLVTGDELVPPGRPLAGSQIHESNSYALVAMLHQLGVPEVSTSQVADDRGATSAALQAALGAADVVVTVGGVSVGEYDFVKECAAELGVTEIYWRIDMKPGKPNYLGVLRSADGGRSLLFGLPGNPVSAQVSCHQLVGPALRRMMGLRQVAHQRMPAVLSEPIMRSKGRREFLRGRAQRRDDTLMVHPLGGQGSHMQVALAEANCLIDVPGDRRDFPVGTVVDIDVLAWSRLG